MDKIKSYQIDQFTVLAELGYSEEHKPQISITTEMESEGVSAAIHLGYETTEKRDSAWEEMDESKVHAITYKLREMILAELQEEEPLFPEQ